MKKENQVQGRNSKNGAGKQSAKPRQSESVKAEAEGEMIMPDDTMRPRIERGDTLMLGPDTKPHVCATAVVQIRGFPQQWFVCRVESCGGAFTLWHNNPDERFGPRCPIAEFVSFAEVLEVRRNLRPTWAEEVKTLWDKTERLHEAVNRCEGLLYLLGEEHGQAAMDNNEGAIDKAKACSLHYLACDTAALLVKELDEVWNAVTSMRIHADEAAQAVGTEAAR